MDEVLRQNFDQLNDPVFRPLDVRAHLIYRHLADEYHLALPVDKGPTQIFARNSPIYSPSRISF